MKGVFRILSSSIDSTVWGSSPCMRSTTRMAMSHSPDPRERRLVKDSCPESQQKVSACLLAYREQQCHLRLHAWYQHNEHAIDVLYRAMHGRIL